MKQTRERWSGPSANVNFRLARELKDRFYEECKANEVSPSLVIRTLMAEYTFTSTVERIDRND